MKARALLALLLLLPLPSIGATEPVAAPEPPVDATILHETFDGGAGFASRGWRVDLMAGDGVGFAVERGAARTQYVAGLDARLVAPELDLRHVAGAPLPPGAAAPAQPSLVEPLAWPPNGSVSLAAPSVASAAHVRLRLLHEWDFAPGDGAFVEARALGAGGVWSPWRELTPVVPDDALVQAGGVLEAPGYAMHDGRLATGEPGFVGASPRALRTEYDLGPFAGSVIEVGFRARSSALLPPDAAGWGLDDVQVNATLDEPDVAVEGFAGLADGRMVASLGAPAALVRNWGPAATGPVVVTLEADGPDGRPVAAASVPVGPVAPGAVAQAQFPKDVDVKGSATLCARLALDRTRVDLDSSDDSTCVRVRVESAMRLGLSAAQDEASAVTALGAAKTIHARVLNEGTRGGPASVGLWAWQLGSAPQQVTSASFEAPAPGSAATLDLRWTPPSRGEWRVEARAEGAASAALSTYVDASPPPALQPDLAPPADPARPWSEGAADRLPGWGFDAWGLDNGTPVPLDPMAPRGTHALAAWARDGLANGSSVRGVVPLRLALPGAAPVALPANQSASVPVNVSYARALLLACPPACDDPGSRVGVVNLSRLANESVSDENLTLSANGTTILVGNGTLEEGGADGTLLYVAADITLDPGAQLAYAPLVLAAPNGSATLLPAGRAWPYEGGARCCVFGPYSAADLLAALPAPAAANGTQALARYVVERDLSDLYAAAGPGEHEIVFESRGAFSWDGAAGVRGHVQLLGGIELPDEAGAAPDAATFERATAGWEGVAIPVHPDAGAQRLRLTLEVAGGNLTAQSPDAPTWLVDEVRLLERADGTQPWRVVGRAEGFEEGGAAWSGDWGLAAQDLPSAHGRGWGVVALPDVPPHRWSLEGGALAWRESPGAATSEPVWSVARTPFVSLAGVPAPEVRFETRYDFGADQAGRNLAGGALVAVLEANATEPEERVLLAPDAGAEGSAYRGDVDAPAFQPLARALGARVPAGATATAWVGNASWVPVRVGLAPLASALATRRVALELHALASAPLQGEGWSVRGLRVGAPGPAHDVKVELPGVAPAVGLGAPVPLSVSLADAGLFAPRRADVTVSVVNASGGIEYGPETLRVDDPGALPAPGASRLLALPQAWVPASYGPHVLRVSVATDPPDESPLDDLLSRAVDVRDELDAALAVPAGGLVEGDPRPGAPLGLQVDIINQGTLPLDAARPATISFQVLDASGRSALAAPVSLDAAAALGRPVAPGERATISAPAAWTPSSSGAYRVVASLALPGAAPVVGAEQPLRVEEAIPLDLAAAQGQDPWSNATGVWRFEPRPGVDSSLALPPLDLRGAVSATLEVRHRYALEEGFDGGRLEALSPSGPWVPVPPAGGEPGALLAPSALDANASAPAFTGVSGGERVDRFDLSAAPALRERLQLPVPSDPENRWAGPQREGNATAWYVGPHDAPAGAPADATAFLRVDALAFPVDVPAGARGDLEARVRVWASLGVSGDPHAPPSLARLALETPDGSTRFEGPAVSSTEGWTDLAATFPGAGAALAGRSARLVVEVRALAPRSTGFADDAAAPFGGVALASPRVETAEGAPLPLGNATAEAASTWLRAEDDPNARLPLAPASDGFRLLADMAPPAWRALPAGGWRLDSAAGGFADARLVFPVDLTTAVANATLRLDETRSLHGSSQVGVEASDDDGRTWRAAPEIGNATYDLTPFAGRPVLVALRAALSTAPAARGDFWEARGARLEADVFRGDEVRLRFRGSADATGTEGSWQILGATLRVLRHGEGAGLRLLAPTDAPLTQGYRTLLFEVVNRGQAAWPGGALHVRVFDPPEWGPRPPHETTRQVPPLAPGESAQVPVRGVDINWILVANASASRVEADLAAAPGETLLADNRVDALVGGANVRERSRVVPLRLDATPQVLDPASGGEIVFHALVANDGEDPASLGASTLEIFHDNESVRLLPNARPLAARLGPGETLDVTWRWRPPASFPAGDYVAVAHVATTTPRGALVLDANATFHVGRFLGRLAYAEPFGATADQAATAPGWDCLTRAPCAMEDPTRHASPPVGLAVGLPPADATDSATVASLQSPPFPVAGFAGAWLRLAVLHDLPAGAAATVWVAPLFANGTQGAWTPAAQLAGRSPGASQGRFAPVERDLSPLLAPDVQAVRLRVDAPRPPAGGASYLVIDDASVTPLNASFGPLPDAALPDAAQKRLRFEVRNEGELGDAYLLSLADAAGRPAALPAGWNATFVDALTGKPLAGPLAVPAHDARALDLVLTTAPSLGAGPLRGPVPLPLTLRSTLLPNLTRSATWSLHAAGLPRPDLAVTGLRVRGDDEPAGQPRTVELDVANLGLADAAAPLSFLARPPDGVVEAPDDLSPKGDIILAAGATRALEISWTPRHAGTYRLEARLDPAGAVPEADRANDAASLSSAVAPLPFPDLRVGLALDDAAPAVGAPVGYHLRVENRGAAAARGVEVALAAGVESLLEGETSLPVGDLAPGASWTRNASWTPQVPGIVRLTASAYARGGAPEPVATLDDNAATLSTLVREEAAHVQPLPPDDARSALFRLTNLGNAPETYALQPEAPDGWALSTEANGTAAGSVDLPAGGWVVLRVRALPPDSALAGSVPVGLSAVDAEGKVHAAQGSIDVPRRPALDVSLLPSDGSTLPVLLDNRGNAPETVHLRTEGFPASWSLRAATLLSQPGERRVAQVPLDLGGDDAPRAIPVSVTWTSEDLAGRAQGAVRLAPRHDLRLDLQGNLTAGAESQVTLLVRNAGNVPEEGVLSWDLPPGSSAAPAARSYRVAPGATAALGYSLLAPAGAQTLPLVARAEGTTDASLARNVTLLVADVGLDNVTREGARWSIAAQNRGDVPAPAVAELYVDGAGVAQRDLGVLDPGALVESDLAWNASAPGPHSYAVVLAPREGFVDARPEDNARLGSFTLAGPASPLAVGVVRRAAPDAGLPLALLAVAALALARRWRR